MATRQRRRISFGSAPGRNRTCDLALRRRTLYPLSYRRGTTSVARVEVTARTATLELAQTFVISRESSDTAEVVFVEVQHGKVSGFGEAAPIERYGESAESALAYVEEHGDLLGDDPFALDAIEHRLPPGEWAARAAIDAALHDLQGKLVDLPVWRLLGLEREGPPTSWTIWLGDPDDMARRAARAVDFTRLKLKLGAGDGLDVERVRAVSEVTQASLQVDVNEAWTFDEAHDALPQLAELGVEYCEQPLPAGDPDGPRLKETSPLPIYVDEDCQRLSDVVVCAERAHGINIKLAKSGGIREALRMAHAARALDLGVMLGCMVESGLGIAAAAQIASLCNHVDLDGNLLLAEDPWPGVEFSDGIQWPAEQAGLGVRTGARHGDETRAKVPRDTGSAPH
jgi:L-alanine-DL-glutamate epimerase-like enolase superfamily enzyme